MVSSTMRHTFHSHKHCMALELRWSCGFAVWANFPCEKGCNSNCQHECIRVLNTYRANHGAQNLIYSQDLADKAQLWADGGQFGYDMSLRGKYGQLIEWDIKNKLPSFTAVIKRWHDNEKEYNFREEKSNNGKTLHDFTQVVWKGAMHAGCGLGKLLGSRYYVVWMDADGVLSPNLGGIGTETVGHPKQKDLNWFKDTLPELKNNIFDENGKEERNKLNKEEQTETIDNVAVEGDESEEKVLNSETKYKNTMQTESQFAHAHIQSLRNPDVELNTRPPLTNTTFSNITKTLENYSSTAKYKERKRQNSEIEQTDSHDEDTEKINTQTKLEFDPTYPVEDQGNLYNELISMSQGSLKSKDEDEIQDVSSEIKSSYSGKTSQTNSELPQLISDPSEPKYQKEFIQKILSPDLDDVQHLVSSSSEELKVNNEPVISDVGEPMRSISAVGIPLQFFRKTNVSSFSIINTSSSTTTNTSNKNVAVSTTHKNKSNELLQQNRAADNGEVDTENNWNTIYAMGKLNFSLKFPFKKNTSIESSDHLIQMNLSRGEPLKVTRERLSSSQSVYTANPPTETKTNNRQTSKLEMNPLPSSTTTVRYCNDVSNKCTLWAQHKKCKDIAYMEYMRQNCKQTCGYCGLPEIILENESNGHLRSFRDYKNRCKDSKEHHFSCPVWSYHGYCEKQPKLMKLFCRKSCDLCGNPRSSLSYFTQHANKPRTLPRKMLKLRNPEYVGPKTLKAFEENGSEKFHIKRKKEENSTSTGESFSYKQSIRHGNFASANVNKVNKLLTFKTLVEKEKKHIKSILNNSNEDKAEATKGGIIPVSTSGCNASCQNDCLQAHNSYRLNHGAPALRLSQRLSDQAQTWANRKMFKHSPWASGQGGESIALGGLYPSFTAAVKAWHDEEKDYDWSTGRGKNQANVAHFIQVVWKRAKLLGCGRSLVKNEPLYVAQMDISGVVTNDLPGYGSDNIGAPLKDDTKWFMDSSPYWKELQAKNTIPMNVEHLIL